MTRVYAQKTVFGLVSGLDQRDRKRPRRYDGLETENVFETGKQFFCVFDFDVSMESEYLQAIGLQFKI